VGIHTVDQLGFLAADPALDFLFPLNCVAGVTECFAVDEAREVVAAW